METTPTLPQTTAVMGFGNPVRSDDAVGIYVIERLREKLGDASHVNLFDMGTSAFEVLFKLKGHGRIILVDGVVNTGDPAGTLYQVPAAEVARAPQHDPLVFLHGLKWDQALSYAKRILGPEYPDDIQVYLVAIDDTRLEIRLSEAARAAGDRVAELIWNQIQPVPHEQSAVENLAPVD